MLVDVLWVRFPCHVLKNRIITLKTQWRLSGWKNVAKFGRCHSVVVVVVVVTGDYSYSCEPGQL